MNTRYVTAASLLWGVWALSWLAAVLWRGGKVARAARSSYGVPLALAFLGYGGLFVEAPAVRHPLWIVPPPLGWGLVALVAAGAGFAWWARIHLGALWSAGIVRRTGHRVVQSGPYALVRHPIYTGLIAAAIGLAGVKATPLAIAGAALVALGFSLKARVEERFLGSELGEAAYADYRARVPMVVPWPR